MFEPTQRRSQYQLIRTVEFGEKADNLRYVDGCVYVGYGQGAIGVIRDEVIVRDETLPGCSCKAHPECF